MRPPIVGETHGQLPDAAAACAVRAEPGIAHDRCHRSDVDDSAAAVRDHLPRHRLRDEERAAKVRVEDQIPIIPGHVDRLLPHVAAGVVHENVEARVRFRRVADHAADARLIAHVELERHGPASHGFDFFLKWLK